MKKITAFLLQAFLFTGIFAQNVGIGTTTPFTKLHVAGTESNIAILSGGTSMFITLAENGVNRGYIGSYSGNAEDVDFGTYGNSPGKLHLTTGANTPRLTITSNGNVGIGTTTPEQLFSVAGGMVIDQNNLNIGTAANMLRFGSNSGEGIGSNRNSGINLWALDFYTNNIRRMTIANNGNVGIGTINPQALLDINGDINIENRLLLNNSAGAAGQTLVSNGAGMAPSWKGTSFSNNDRFLFKTQQVGSNTSSFSDTLTYDGIYAYSSAVTYNNGVFTINKSGLYQIEGYFTAFVAGATGEYASASVQLMAANSLILAFDAMSPSGSDNFAKTFNTNICLYFLAGSTFYLHGGIGTSGAAAACIFFNDGPLSINLVSD